MVPLIILAASALFNAILLGTIGLEEPDVQVGTTIDQDESFGVFQVFDAIADWITYAVAAATWDFPGMPIQIRALVVVALVGSLIWAIVELIRGN